MTPSVNGPGIVGSRGRLPPSVKRGGASNTPPQETSTGATLPNLLGFRVDALTLAYRVAFSQEALSYLEARAAVAEAAGQPASVTIGSTRWRMRRLLSPGRWTLENADGRALLELRAPGATAELPGWTLEYIPRAVFLASRGYRAAIETGRGLALELGRLLGERLRRVDVAADWGNWPLCEADAPAWVRRGRSACVSFPVQVPLAADKIYRVDQRVTGFVLAPGAPVLLRVYDKIEELGAGRAADGSPSEKYEAERVTWNRAGWREGDPVTRVEFQVRGEALTELGLRNPRELAEKLPALWAYLTGDAGAVPGDGQAQGWARLVELETASRRSRCRTDPRWELVRRVPWSAERAPALRRLRRRGFARFGQAFGSLVGYLADTSRLPPLPPELDNDLELETVARLTDDELEAYADEIAAKLAGALRDTLRRRFRSRRALGRAVVGYRAVIARRAFADEHPATAPPEAANVA